MAFPNAFPTYLLLVLLRNQEKKRTFLLQIQIWLKIQILWGKVEL